VEADPTPAKTPADEELERHARWSDLPDRILPEDMVTSQDESAPPPDLGLDLNRENWIRYV
jgi:hypothetical protein